MNTTLLGNLRGRVLKREIPAIMREFNRLRQPELEEIRTQYAVVAHGIFSAWAKSRVSDADMAILERHGCVQAVKGVNVRAYNEETSHWDRVFGIPFPEGKTVAVPCGGSWYSSEYRDVYCGGPDTGNGMRIEEFASLVCSLHLRSEDFRKAHDEFEAYVESRPLRRELAASRSRIAAAVWELPSSCPECNGTGAIDAPYSGSDPNCPDCDGEGHAATACCTKPDHSRPPTMPLPTGVPRSTEWLGKITPRRRVPNERDRQPQT